ncbi:MAG: hypothetical protein KDD37_01245 [Bdellovibrionales bacterium]|nr:hypothetical protein [Bdellovibrionales bacterium]
MAWMQVLMLLSFSLEIHGHRGARARYPENTLPAFNYALLNGADYVELDTHMTKDGYIVVNHDLSVNKKLCLTEAGETIRKSITILNTDLKDLQTYDCGSVRSRDFPNQLQVPGTKIPSLAEVIVLFKSHLVVNPNLKLNIEIKYEDSPDYPDMSFYVGEIVNLVRGFEIEDNVIYQSFSKDVVSKVKEIDPSSTVYFLFSSVFTNYEAVLKETNADGISAAYKTVNQKMVNKVRDLGKKILSWTVNDKKQWKKLIELGIDGIITDDPEELFKYRKEVSESHLF